MSGPHSLNDTELSLHPSDYLRLLQVKITKISPLYLSLSVLLLLLYCLYLSIYSTQCPGIPSKLSDLVILYKMCEVDKKWVVVDMLEEM